MKETWEEISKKFDTDYAANWYDDMPSNHGKESFDELTEEEVKVEIKDYEYERNKGIYTITGDADPEYFDAIDEILEVLNKRLEELR